MDSLITAAAHALATGDPLGALNRVALRDDAPALALRGIAMAQLGELERARALVRDAARAFGTKEPVARARCIVAEAEVALATRELGWSTKRLDAARATLEARGDRVNAAHARYLEIRRLLLIGQIDEAETRLAALARISHRFAKRGPGDAGQDKARAGSGAQAYFDSTSSTRTKRNAGLTGRSGAAAGIGEICGLDPGPLPPSLQTTHHLIVAGIAMRHLQTRAARAALELAKHTARKTGIPALNAEVASAFDFLTLPAARLIARGAEQPLLLEDVEALLNSNAFVVDACRHVVRQNEETVSLATRPVLFTLTRVLAEAWPEDASRDELVARAFRARQPDESHRARLRVEIGRLRRQLRSLADVTATPRGFVLKPHRAHELAVLAWPVEERHANVLALLADGESWSSSALAIALGTSQRSVQRALDALTEAGKVQSFGRGRARRWTMPPIPGFTTILLLPASLPVD